MIHSHVSCNLRRSLERVIDSHPECRNDAASMRKSVNGNCHTVLCDLGFQKCRPQDNDPRRSPLVSARLHVPYPRHPTPSRPNHAMVTFRRCGAVPNVITRIPGAGVRSVISPVSLLFQGVDWRDPRAGACNGVRNPIQQNFYDGINADPLEVLFIKVKSSMRQAGWEHVTQVRRSTATCAIQNLP